MHTLAWGSPHAETPLAPGQWQCSMALHICLDSTGHIDSGRSIARKTNAPDTACYDAKVLARSLVIDGRSNTGDSGENSGHGQKTADLAERVRLLDTWKTSLLSCYAALQSWSRRLCFAQQRSRFVEGLQRTFCTAVKVNQSNARRSESQSFSRES
ncbi:uncharacterized protein BDR25DRAFT_314898 [Lindgomyces ingoldianus]|uniref:Uncharacterized protein n=1 Tax=Lindgomyces ingoldianus TaxID=673940 RepID=A0ACB6QVQ6_9PLEO|nr:uncharacterized protein BDR25DRAFT_314898 [Lindgomyces ingoldianus]KAF2470165.1 hypothetical protein BDR25DRAFT_314898 [Lindgomyces ingoldianus]